MFQFIMNDLEKFKHFQSKVQQNLSNLTHQGNRVMCRIVHDVGILWFYFSKQKYFGTINFSRMSQDVGKLSSTVLTLKDR